MLPWSRSGPACPDFSPGYSGRWRASGASYQDPRRRRGRGGYRRPPGLPPPPSRPHGQRNWNCRPQRNQTYTRGSGKTAGRSVFGGSFPVRPCPAPAFWLKASTSWAAGPRGSARPPAARPSAFPQKNIQSQKTPARTAPRPAYPRASTPVRSRSGRTRRTSPV